MTDRELLEAAARAAGIELAWHEPDDRDDAAWCYIPSAKPPHNRRAGDVCSGTIWNPLTDDGDALRLAVKLSLRVDAGYCGCADVRGYMVDATEALGHDACAATRRAIVRAAAAMAEKTR